MSKRDKRRGGDSDLRPERVPTGWTDMLLICRKCSRKLDGGFGADGAEPLRQALRAALRAGGQRGLVGLIEVGCFGVCPKRAVTMARASAPGELTIVPAGCEVAGLIGQSREPVGVRGSGGAEVVG
jgi:hypothetical protein